MILHLIFLGVLILCNAFFSAAEAALISLKPVTLEQLSKNGKRGRILSELTADTGSFLATVQVGVTFAGFLASAFAADTFSDPLAHWAYHDLGFTRFSESAIDHVSVVIITLILSYFSLVFGELVPKQIALRYTSFVALNSAIPIHWLLRFASPLVWLLNNSVKLVMLPFGSAENTEKVTEMMGMFSRCSSLTSLDLSGMQLAYTLEYESGSGNVVDDIVLHCDNFLYGCTSLKTLTIPKIVSVRIGSVLDPDVYDHEEWVDIYGDVDANLLPSDALEGIGTQAAPCTLIYPSDFTPEKTSTGNGWYMWKGGYFKDQSSATTKAYAVLSGSTLTFYNDASYGSRSGAVYDLNSGTTAPSWSSKASTVTKVVFNSNFASAAPTTCYQWFYNMTGLTTITGIENLKTSSVTNMSGMFQNCSSLTSLDLGTFNTAKVTNMSSMFSGCTKLGELILYSVEGSTGAGDYDYDTEFVTTKATNLKEMFKNCKALTTVKFPGLALTSSTTTTSMFSGCSAVTFFSVANNLANAPAATFAGLGTAAKPCNLYSDYLPADATYTPTYLLWKGGYFHDTLRQAYAVFEESDKTLTFYYDSPGLWVVSEGGFSLYFLDNTATTPEWSAGATAVTKVVFTDDFKYARPTTCQRWFNGMTNLATITGIKNLNTSYVTNMAYMFQNCKKLKSLDISSFTLSSSTTTTSMMKSCSALTSLTIPSTANSLSADACSGVGTQAAPCPLDYPSGFSPDKTSSGSGYYVWKGGYFTDKSTTPVVTGTADAD